MDENNQEIIKLYVADISTDTQEAILSIKQILSDSDDIKFKLDVVDVFEQPEVAEMDGVIATPTISRDINGENKKIILNFNNKEKFMMGVKVLLRGDL